MKFNKQIGNCELNKGKEGLTCFIGLVPITVCSDVIIFDNLYEKENEYFKGKEFIPLDLKLYHTSVYSVSLYK